METLHLLYCGNDDAYEEILLSLLSVMRHTKRRLGVYLLTAIIDRYDGAPMKQAKAEYLSALLRGRGDGSYLVFKDMTDVYEEAFGDMDSVALQADPYFLIRLLADKANLPQRILYLDCDTVAAGDVGQIFDHDLCGLPFGAAGECFASGIPLPGVFNFGVLLFDMDAAVREGIFQRARDALKGRKHILSVGLSDAFLKTKRARLPRRFNEQKGLREDTVLRHFATTLSFFPYPHLKKHKSFERQKLSKKERALFGKVIDRFYFCRDAYLEYEKKEGQSGQTT